MDERREPDLVNDRFIIAQGGVLPDLFSRIKVVFPPLAYTLLRSIPADPADDQADFPQDSAFRISADVLCGTVDEILGFIKERFLAAIRAGLFMPYNGMAGEVDAYAKHAERQEWLRELGIGGLAVNDPRLTEGERGPRMAARLAQRARGDDPKASLLSLEVREKLDAVLDLAVDGVSLAMMAEYVRWRQAQGVTQSVQLGDLLTLPAPGQGDLWGFPGERPRQGGV